MTTHVNIKRFILIYLLWSRINFTKTSKWLTDWILEWTNQWIEYHRQCLSYRKFAVISMFEPILILTYTNCYNWAYDPSYYVISYNLLLLLLHPAAKERVFTLQFATIDYDAMENLKKLKTPGKPRNYKVSKSWPCTTSWHMQPTIAGTEELSAPPESGSKNPEAPLLLK